MSGALYRFALIAASLGGAAIGMCGMWLVAHGDGVEAGRAMVDGGLALTIAAAGASVLGARVR